MNPGILTISCNAVFVVARMFVDFKRLSVFQESHACPTMCGNRFHTEAGLMPEKRESV